jgi:signal transduction histidine kinase
MDPAEIRHSVWAYGLLAFYIAQGTIVIMLLRLRQQPTVAFLLLVHGADILWPALVSLFTTGAGGFFLFFVFVLTAAAYRWGLWETVGTAVAAVLLLSVESIVFHLGVLQSISGFLTAHHWPPLAVDLTTFQPERLLMRAIYLLVMGLLLGYLAEQQKQLRAEKAVVARILGKASVEAGLSGTIQEIVGELLVMYGAREAIVASHEGDARRVFVGEVKRKQTDEPVFRWLDPSERDYADYLGPCEAATCYAIRLRQNGAGPFRVVGLTRDGERVRKFSSEFLTGVARHRTFDSLMSVSFSFGREWAGRIFLLDPALTGDIEEELHFLQELVRQVGPAVYNVYLLRRLRLRAGAVERARFARELHDGAVQSLIAVEMQVDVLKRQAANNSVSMPDELGRIQGLLREEVLKLRELMQQMKSLDVDSRKLIPFLADTVDRFQRETGITARFISEMEQVDMPAQTCRELARIVQEALVNVRKHSGARQVLVRLGAQAEQWTITIEDDGRGFPFSGRLGHDEMDSIGRGPLVIKERVRLIEGELTIESNPGRGSRLQIKVPQKTRQAAYG